MKKLFVLQAAILVSLLGCTSGNTKKNLEPKEDKTSKNCNVPGCSSDSLPTPVKPLVGIDEKSKPPVRPRPSGSDKDSHGCTPSAGFLWCAKTNSCQRPWVLAKKEGFIEPTGIYETRKAFAVYCGNKE